MLVNINGMVVVGIDSKKIAQKGISVMSYFIGDGNYDRSRNMRDFKKMYGNDASFINATNMMEVSKTMNKKFLEV